MKSTELVWREIADAAVMRGMRHWQSFADLAFAADVPQTTAQLACRKLIDIGAIEQHRRGGFSVASPEKLLTLSCAWRNLKADTLLRTTTDALRRLTETAGSQVALGGPDAAVHYLGGENKVAGFSRRIAYLPADSRELEGLPTGDEVLILRMDSRAELDWDGYSSFTQTYADLFATPGWQASEFRLALRDRFFRQRDWDQPEDNHA